MQNAGTSPEPAFPNSLEYAPEFPGLTRNISFLPENTGYQLTYREENSPTHQFTVLATKKTPGSGYTFEFGLEAIQVINEGNTDSYILPLMEYRDYEFTTSDPKTALKKLREYADRLREGRISS